MSTPDSFARTSEPPSYAAIFTSKSTLADGVGITIRCWRDEAALIVGKRDTEHEKAQRGGRLARYERYKVRVARVGRAYGFARGASA